MEFSFRLRCDWRVDGSNGGGMEHGLESAGVFTIESIMNFFAKPGAGHAIDSEHNSIAFGGIIGL